MLKTPLNSWHHSHQGRMVDFAGWEMPVQYSSIVDEHNRVRSSAGLFDISHMGRLEFRGDGAEALLNLVLTNDTGRLKTGDIRYSLICREDGGILDDVLIYRLPNRWVLVVNASNREKIVGWLKQQSGFAASGFEDLTLLTGMIAVQGPKSAEIVTQLTGTEVGRMKYYSGQDVSWNGISGLISRTGYTGEDGFEISVPNSVTEPIWERLLELGQSSGIAASGLGCRDTLRLEAAMPLYGHELSESIDPLSAGLSFAVRMQKDNFIGQAALRTVEAAGVSQTRVGLILEGRRIAREETPVLNANGVIGKVTSGTFSPTLQKSIAMAYVPTDAAVPGSHLQVDLRGTLIPATVVPLPFYKRPKS